MQKKLYKYALKTIAFLIFAFAFSANFCFAEDQKTEVIDGDSLEINGERIRLAGIDAPEYRQYCFDAEKKKYDCGIEAKKYLQTLVDAPDFYCKTKDVDIYKRKLSVCYAYGKNINKKMIEEGWAIAYRTNNPFYHIAQMRAKINGKGIFQGKFIAPEIYRRMNKRKKK